MTMQTIQHVPNVRCGHCHGYHTSVDDIRECSRLQGVGNLAVRPAAAEQAQAFDPIMSQDPNTPLKNLLTRGSTFKQLNYISILGGNAFAARLYTKEQATDEITRLQKEKPKEKTVSFSMKVPIGMLEMVPDGYYAVQADADDPMKFFRVSRPKKGWSSGAIKIQSQHSDILKEVLVVWPGGERGQWYNRSKESDLLLLVVDPNGATIRYAEELGQCCRCNKALTDERSRWYGIGPDCEKIYSHIIDIVDDRKGAFEDRP